MMDGVIRLLRPPHNGFYTEEPTDVDSFFIFYFTSILIFFSLLEIAATQK